MKYSLHSINPFAWCFQKSLSKQQCLLYDIGQSILAADSKLEDLELQRIEYEALRSGLVEQKKFLLEGTPEIQDTEPMEFPILHIVGLNT